MANVYTFNEDTARRIINATRNVERLSGGGISRRQAVLSSDETSTPIETFPFQLHYEKTETVYNLYVNHGFVYLGVMTILHADLTSPLVITASAYIYLKITINAETDNYVLEIKQAPTDTDIEQNSNECFIYHIGYVEWGIVQEATETEPAVYGIKSIVQYLKQNLIATGRMW